MNAVPEPRTAAALAARRSKTDTAMKNEVLCKFLCYNICVVHQSHIRTLASRRSSGSP